PGAFPLAWRTTVGFVRISPTNPTSVLAQRPAEPRAPRPQLTPSLDAAVSATHRRERPRRTDGYEPDFRMFATSGKTNVARKMRPIPRATSDLTRVMWPKTPMTKPAIIIATKG